MNTKTVTLHPLCKYCSNIGAKPLGNGIFYCPHCERAFEPEEEVLRTTEFIPDRPKTQTEKLLEQKPKPSLDRDALSWEYIAQAELGFLDGMAVKLISLFRERAGLSDLQEARMYLDKLIEIEEAKHGA
jgi:hypothetical protein